MSTTITTDRAVWLKSARFKSLTRSEQIADLSDDATVLLLALRSVASTGMTYREVIETTAIPTPLRRDFAAFDLADRGLATASAAGIPRYRITIPGMALASRIREAELDAWDRELCELLDRRKAGRS